MQHHVTVTVQNPDGSRNTFSGPGESIGSVTDAELLDSARTAALAEAPDGATVVRAELD
ncbi:hypothetical protein [Streptomyces cacaoi]|uniref:hypothetical protein n=1 Tax=Streptomyces cacaoi TaxID=1898 RepID=UPI002621CEE8|nr:hypothetical protein [Streptomyces cacaoi]